MAWYSHLLKNFPQFIVIHTVEGFDIVNNAERDAFLELSCFFDDPSDVGNLISGSSAFSKFQTPHNNAKAVPRKSNKHFIKTFKDIRQICYFICRKTVDFKVTNKETLFSHSLASPRQC